MDAQMYRSQGSLFREKNEIETEDKEGIDDDE